MQVVHSANFRIHPRSGLVEYRNSSFTLAPVNMKVLMLFLSKPGVVISRSEFYERVWKNQEVSDDALTRCISDLRTQFGKFNSEVELIETLPKRGYRWLAEVNDRPADRNLINRASWIQIAIWVLLSILFIALLFAGLLWFLQKQINVTHINIALIPLQTTDPSHRFIATEFEDSLKQSLLNTPHLRFLANSAMRNSPSIPYPYLFKELGTRWIIEGQIRERQDSLRVTLNLVDARTALVTYTRRWDVKQENINPKNISDEFVNQLQVLEPPP